MVALTVKNIPDETYEALKQLAEANHHSIDCEVIACIEQAVPGRKIDPAVVLKRARELRKLTQGHPITDAELTRAKNERRP